MSIRRFMIRSACIVGDLAFLDGELFNHAARVLRMASGNPLVLVDESGTEHRGRIDRVEREMIVVRLTSSLEPVKSPDDSPRLTICQALPKGEKTDLILQKGTELGVHDFLLFGGLRSVPRIGEEQRAKKLERWNRITAEAARQCGRRHIPAVAWLPGAKEAADGCEQELRLLLWEDERTRRLKSVVGDSTRPLSAVVAIGPEGGFDPWEVERFRQSGFIPVTMGDRILRTETAALAVTAILQYIWENE